MKHLTYLFLFLSLIYSSILHSQVLFIEDVNWGKEIEKPIPDSLDFIYVSSIDSIQKGDTSDIRILYPNNNVAIEGQVVHSRNKLTKIGTWNYYYEDGKLWSVREYKKFGKLTEVHKLQSKDGLDLPRGFGRHIGKHNYLTGYNYIYDQDGKASNIIQYSGGQIVKSHPLDKYSNVQLSRLKIRNFEIDKDSYLEELSFEEAFEKQKEKGKTILLCFN